MACCGKRRRATISTSSKSSTPPSLPSTAPRVVTPSEPASPPDPAPQPPPPVAKRATPQKKIVQPQLTPKSAPQGPKVIPASNNIPACRYRDVKSTQVIGGVQVQNFWCRAFNINVRAEQCRVCTKHDK